MLANMKRPKKAYLCRVKNRLLIAALVIAALVTCAAGLVGFAGTTSGNADVAHADRCGLELPSVHASDASFCDDDAYEGYTDSAFLAQCSNVSYGHVRTATRCARNYFPNASLRDADSTAHVLVSRIPDNRRVSLRVKLSPDHGFIRFRKLLI